MSPGPASTYGLAFETVGNATLIVHDERPVLATDPWLFGPAYFGSWTLSHEIPEEQRRSISDCEYVWVSHGHPDHLSWPSLETLADKQILLPDHLGGRIHQSLTDAGFRVAIAPDRQWMSVSPRVRIMSISDIYQDAVLLVDLDGVLVMDVNDATDHGWGRTVRRAARRSRAAFLLALSGYGDADMINYFTPEGERIPPRAAKRIPPGPAIIERMQRLGAQYFVPFASLHRYQRADSVWANEYTTGLDDFARGFESPDHTMLPAFVRYDCLTGDVVRLDPPAQPATVHPPTDFGDDWDDLLSDADVDEIRTYFTSITTLQRVVDTIVFRIGGTDHEIVIAPPGGTPTGRSVRFETPRASLMSAVRLEIFDDLLIGNFMRTTLLGDWGTKTLRPDFTACVAKYADNGWARTPEQVASYLATYRRRAPLDSASHRIAGAYRTGVVSLARRANDRVRRNPTVHRLGSKVYRRLRP